MSADKAVEGFQTVAVTFKQGVAIEDLHSALDRLLESLAPAGCSRCGLGGIDVMLRAGDPEPFARLESIRELDSVLDISQRSGPIGF